MKKRFFYATFTILFFFIASGFLKPQNIETPHSVMLGSVMNVKNTLSFKRLLQSQGTVFEKAKIEYLISRVRKSPHLFIRNGQAYKGSRAAMHLLFKYQRKHSLINTAQDFINHLASKSSASGKLYAIQLVSGEVYPTRDILQNELRYLEANLLN